MVNSPPYEDDTDSWLSEWNLLEYNIELRNNGWESSTQREQWVTEKFEEEQQLEEFMREYGYYEDCLEHA